jgi:PAS domain S-box-containing protein
MAEQSELSRTMRIDLIPDIPAEPVMPSARRVIVALPRKSRAVELPPPHAVGLSRYQELLQGLYDAALISDLSGRIRDVNLRATEFFLYPREELCRLSVFDVISGADDSLLQTLNRNLEGERYTLIQAYCVRQDRSFFPAEIAVSRLNLGRTCLGFFVRDITRRRQAEEMLRTEHTALQNAGNGIAVADLEARLEYVNPALASMWGYAGPDELTGLEVRRLFADPAAAERMLQEATSERGAWTGELTGRRADGREFSVQAGATRNRNSDGDVVGLVLSFVDVTDRKRAELALREAERHRVMLESLGAVCHHVGQPATVLMGNLELMRQGMADADPELRRLLDSSIESMCRLGEVLAKLQNVDQYRTSRYLDSSAPTQPGGAEIIEI